MIDNEGIARELVSGLGRRPAIIRKGHGIVTLGKNLEGACLLAIMLEGLARNQILARKLRNLVPFEKEKVREFAKS